MPLPSLRLHGAKRCQAKSKRSGRQCENPAAFGMTKCRMHGARRRSAILSGASHPNYKHGWETIEAKARRARKLADLREIERLMIACKLIDEN